MINTIIFYFDGVITESVGVKTDGFAMLYGSYSFNIVDKVLDHHYNNGGVSRFKKFRIYHKEFFGKDINDVELKILSEKFSEFVVNRIIEASYVNGALEFLKSHHKNYNCIISRAFENK